MTERTRASWLVYVLGALCAGAIVAAILVVGPASGSQTTVTRTAIAAQGVVQSTVSGSGNLQAASQLDLGFKTSGTVTNIYVTQGQHVTPGQLLATLNPESAEVTLEQARASVQSAVANLAQEEENDGETSSTGQASGGSNANAASVSHATTPTTTTPTAPTTTSPTTTPPQKTTTTPATTSPATTPSQKTTTTTHETATEAGGSSSSSSSTASKPAESPATREANIASARANVSSDRLTVQSDEQAVQNTKLYAPEDGTIVSLSGQVGETVSGGGTTKASSSSSSSSGSGTGATATGVGGASASGARSSVTGSTGSSNSSTSSSSSSSSFAVLSDLSSMQLVVPLSESEIGNVKDGQTATVTVEALNGAKLAAHVGEVALLSTSNSGVVSYDVTFQLDQLEAGLKVGMSATAEVVVKQAEGVNVPTSAISADSVTVERAGKQVRQRVVTGLAGNTSTIVLSGLKAGETVVLPAATTSSSSTSLTSRLGSRTGGLGGAGGLAGGGGGGFVGGGGGGGAAFFRGGG
jgi:multidrug efflux pump subunit AcrA (membrane-fusion protein)